MIYTTSPRILFGASILFYIAKLQILNDIHNQNSTNCSAVITVLYCKVTNLEWYTQQRCSYIKYGCYCFILQSYKSWMIYTTGFKNSHIPFRLFYIAKLQILNDIHNDKLCVLLPYPTVLYCKVTNLEWYTQLLLKFSFFCFTVLYCKVTNLEWYTQLK